MESAPFNFLQEFRLLSKMSAFERFFMAFGKNWEWRGFGAIPAPLRGDLEALSLVFPEPQDLKDEYLWAASISINVKIRFGSLKLKRFLGAEDGLERWLEDPEENYSFPLSPSVVRGLCRELHVEAPLMKGPVDREGFLGLLERLLPPPRILVVEKRRWQRLWREEGSCGEGEGVGGGEGKGGAVVVEIAEIFAPQRISSVALEHSVKEKVARAVSALGLEGSLRRFNYLEALSIWARGNEI